MLTVTYLLQWVSRKGVALYWERVEDDTDTTSMLYQVLLPLESLAAVKIDRKKNQING